MAHNRKLVIGVVALTRAKIRGDIPLLTVIRDRIEQDLIDDNFFEGAPFSWVGLVLRYGLKSDISPSFEAVNKRDGDSPIALEIDCNSLLGADKSSLERQLTLAVPLALIETGKLFGLKTKKLEERKRVLLDGVVGLN